MSPDGVVDAHPTCGCGLGSEELPLWAVPSRFLSGALVATTLFSLSVVAFVGSVACHEYEEFRIDASLRRERHEREAALLATTESTRPSARSLLRGQKQ